MKKKTAKRRKVRRPSLESKVDEIHGHYHDMIRMKAEAGCRADQAITQAAMLATQSINKMDLVIHKLEDLETRTMGLLTYFEATRKITQVPLPVIDKTKAHWWWPL